MSRARAIERSRNDDTSICSADMANHWGPKDQVVQEIYSNVRSPTCSLPLVLILTSINTLPHLLSPCQSGKNKTANTWNHQPPTAKHNLRMFRLHRCPSSSSSSRNPHHRSRTINIEIKSLLHSTSDDINIDIEIEHSYSSHGYGYDYSYGTLAADGNSTE
jgi:hypothetical protein